MIIQSISKPRKARGLAADDRQKAIDYLHGMVDAWCKNNPGEWFALRDLVGGVNWEWSGTPLKAVFDNRKARGSSNPVKAAGIDVGNLLKQMLIDDRRTTNIDKRLGRWSGLLNG